MIKESKHKYFLRVFFCCFNFILINTLYSNAQTSFTPLNLSGLTVWLRSDTGIVLNLGNVSLWEDQSGNGNDAIQGSSSLQPLYVASTNQINKKPSINLDGVDDVLEILDNSSVDFVEGMTIFIVLKQDVLKNDECFLSKWDFSADGSWAFQTDYSTSKEVRMYVSSGGIRAYSTDATFNDNNFSITGLVYDGTLTPANRLLFYQNSVLLSNSIDGTVPSSLKNTTEDIRIGTFKGLGRYYNGDIAEIIVYGQALSDPDRNLVEQYLRYKYAPPVNLGLDTTVCSLPFTLRGKKDYYANYSWTGGSTADSIVISAVGDYELTVTDIFGFVSKDTITISLDSSPFVVNLGPDITICSGEQKVIDAGPSHLSYVWSNGATTDTVMGFVNATYTVSVSDCLANVSQDEISVSVVPYPTFSLGNDTTTCFNGSNPYTQSANLAGSFSYLWSTGSVNPTIDVSSSGEYSLELTNPGCSAYDTINIVVDSFPQTASLGPDVSLCEGNPIYLISGAAPGNNLVWSGLGSGVGDSIFVGGTPGDYIVNATNTNGCLKTDTIFVNILGAAPVASFEFDTTCLGALNSFTNTSSPPSGDSIVSSNWDFADLSPNSSDISPTHLYADTGAYAVALTVTTGGGCSSTIIHTIKVYPYPQGTFTASDFCEKDTVNFTSMVSDFGYSVTYNWDFGDVPSGVKNNSTGSNPKHVYTNAGGHSVLLTLQNAFGCATIISNPIAIDSLPVIDFSTSTICENELVQFSDKSVIPKSATISGGSWDFNDFSPVSTQINPSHTFGFSKWYNIKRIVSLSNGCKDSITRATFVNPKPQALYSVGNVCAETPAVFKDSSTIVGGGSISSWRWDYGNGLTSTNQNDTQTFVNGLLPIVELLVTSDQGCKDSVSSIITVRPLPNTSFSLSASSGGPPLEVEFTNLSTGANSYNWDLGDFTTSKQTNTSNTYNAVGDYSVVLTAQSNFGCMDTSLRIVRVVEAIWDVAVQNVSTILQNNYLSVLAQYVNKGNVDVTNLELTININDGTGLKENWTGLLARGGVLQDTISTSIFMKSLKLFTCVEAIKPNGFSDEFPSDNKECVAIDRSTFEVLQPYPVPVSDELITLPILIPSEKNIEINIVDNKGALLKNVYSGNISEGLQLISINTTGMTKGFYAFMVTYEGETVVKKFIID